MSTCVWGGGWCIVLVKDLKTKKNNVLLRYEAISPNLMMNVSRQEFSIRSQIPVTNRCTKNYIAEDTRFLKDDESHCEAEVNFSLFNLSA